MTRAARPIPPAPSPRWTDLAQGLQAASVPESPASAGQKRPVLPSIKRRLDKGMIGNLQRLKTDSRKAHWRIWRGYWRIYLRLRAAILLTRLWQFIREFWLYLLLLAVVAGFVALLIIAPELVFGFFRAIGSAIGALIPGFGSDSYPDTPPPSVHIPLTGASQ